MIKFFVVEVLFQGPMWDGTNSIKVKTELGESERVYFYDLNYDELRNS